MIINSETIENINDVKNQGWIYIGDNRERYVLGQPGKYNVLVIGVNPSTATPNHDDPTIRRVRSIVYGNGYDGWIMVNLYPIISINPDKLPKDVENNIIEQNIRIITNVINNYKIGAVWAAWGNLIDKREYLGEALIKIYHSIDGEYPWYCSGALTKKGNPRHPLYLENNSSFESFPVADYISY